MSAPEPKSHEVVVVGSAAGFAQEIAMGEHRLVSDEPRSEGGTDTGPAPYDLLLAALGYSFLVMAITAHGDANHLLRKAIGRDKKGKISLLIYVLAVALAAVHQWISLSLYALVAIIWLIPDRRIEKVLGH